MERVRFAPSPTGPLHIGGLRTALFNYLHAKKNKGVFILRIEDTDQKRKVENSESYILESLQWCGIEPDESPWHEGKYGPYRQSERSAIYKQYIQKLIGEGKAYYGFDTHEELEKYREEAIAKEGGFRYDSSNRMLFKNSLTLNEEETSKKLAAGKFVIRLRVEPEREISVYDEIRGTIRVKSNELEDKVLIKADGLPTYHFANVVDDHLMKISTVIRGEEWLPSLPLHQLLYEAFKWETPKFMHLPLILNPSGKGKLSKRDGDKNGYPVFPLSWNEGQGYREQGFLPEAHLNYIAQLGWSMGEDKEIVSKQELISLFNVNKIQKGGARFDYEKAKWVNQQHIQQKEVSVLMDEHPHVFEHLKNVHPRAVDIVKLIQERLVLLSEVEKETKVFYQDPEAYSGKALKRLKKVNIVEVAKGILEIVRSYEIETWKEKISETAREKGQGMGAFMQVLRLAIVGDLSGPDLLPMAKLIGKDVTIKRLEQLIVYIENQTS